MSGVIVLHYWSPTCGPCKVIKPAIDDMKEEFDRAQWVSINTHDDTNGYAAKYNVNVVPTMVILKNGQEVGRHSGTSMGIYYSLIRRALSGTS